MRLPHPFIQLPFSIDAAPLIREVRALPATMWRAHPEGHAGSAELPLVAPLGNAADHSVAGPMRPTPALAACPLIAGLMAALKVPVGRSHLMRIEGNAEATMHVDTNYYSQRRVRIHVPLNATSPVQFICGDQSLRMKAGECWIFDTWRTHSVSNPEPTERIHLVIDSVGSTEFWARVGDAETQQFEVIPRKESGMTDLLLESTNFPIVMSPTEQRGFIDDIRSDLFHPTQTAFAPAAMLFGLLEQFHLRWTALWNTYGEAESGESYYRAELQTTMAAVAAFQSQVKLGSGTDAAFIARQWLFAPALNPELRVIYAGGTHGDARSIVTTANEVKSPRGAIPLTAPASPPAKVENLVQAEPPVSSARKTRFDRPVFIVAAPRSGSSLLFETLAQSPDFYTVSGESNGYFERFPALKPSTHQWHSNRVTGERASDELASMLEGVLLTSCIDRNGKLIPASNSPFRFLDKTPKNALRIPFLKAAFPSARFIYLYRDPRDNVSNIIDAWQSGRFVTYPSLPGWSPPSPLAWSLALVPGWRELIGESMGQVAAHQWAQVNETILNDLAVMPAGEWCGVSYAEFLAQPQATVERLCAFADVRWDKPIATAGELPLAQNTLTAPDANKWRRNLSELRAGRARVEAVAARANALLGIGESYSLDEPTVANAASAASAAASVSVPPTIVPSPRNSVAYSSVQMEPVSASEPVKGLEEHPFHSTPSANLGSVLQQLKISVAITTYQSNQLLLLRSRGSAINTHFVSFSRPMGMVSDGHRLFLGTNSEVIEFRNMPDTARRRPDQPDAVFVPRVRHTTGEIDIHELGLSKRELWVVNTRFSCLATVDYDHSFVPRWRPSFISGYSTDDRCHLNGLAIVNGQPKYVTALGECDHARGWRDNKAFGGILIDIDTKQVMIRGLSMPHSPRWYRNELWFLESGYGALCTLNRKTGEKRTVAQVPGFTRGLDFYGPLAFIGLSQVRESATFSGIPITEWDIERVSGLWIVNIETGETVASLRFNKALQEVFAVSVLPGVQWPELLALDDPLIGSCYALPDAALRDVRDAPAKPR